MIEQLRFHGLQLDVVATLAMLALGYGTWFAITREWRLRPAGPRHARRRTLRLGRTVAGIVALSWLVTVPLSGRTSGANVALSCIAAALVLMAVGIAALVWRACRPSREREDALARIAPTCIAPARVSVRMRARIEKGALPAGVRPRTASGAPTPDTAAPTRPYAPAASAAGRVLAVTAVPQPPARRPIDEVTRLRRLAIAQQAALNLERDAHARTRESACRAIEIAQHALAERRVAIKLARRERRARLTLEGRLENSRDASAANARAMVAGPATNGAPGEVRGTTTGRAADGAADGTEGGVSGETDEPERVPVRNGSG